MYELLGNLLAGLPYHRQGEVIFCSLIGYHTDVESVDGLRTYGLRHRNGLRVTGNPSFELEIVNRRGRSIRLWSWRPRSYSNDES